MKPSFQTKTSNDIPHENVISNKNVILHENDISNKNNIPHENVIPHLMRNLNPAFRSYPSLLGGDSRSSRE